MNVRQRLSVLFFPKNQNDNSDGNAPIYVRITTPESVKRSYQTPINGHDQHRQKMENLEFSEQLDNVISEYVLLCKK